MNDWAPNEIASPAIPNNAISAPTSTPTVPSAMISAVSQMAQRDALKVICFRARTRR